MRAGGLEATGAGLAALVEEALDFEDLEVAFVAARDMAAF
jgi:hypothetical protein